MKTIIIFLLATTVAFSQTREPSQHTFSIFDSTHNRVNILLDTDNDYFKLNNFQMGWHWGSMKVLSRALLMNQGDISTITTETFFHEGDFNTNTNYFVRAFYDTVINGKIEQGHLYSHTYYDNHIVFTNGMTYDPSLYIDPTDTFRLNIRTSDPQNPVFGFMQKRGRVLSNPSDPNYSRLIIDSSNLKNQIILSEPWLSDQLTYEPIGRNNYFDSIINRDFSGARYYVSINLRRFGINDTIDDQPVLKIEVPFVYRYPNKTTPAYGTAVFDSIPGTTYDTLPYSRGNALNLMGAGSRGSSEMIITRRMLPLTRNDNGDITISGFIDFRKYNISEMIGNKPLRESISGLDSGKIDQLKLKITYLGNCDVAIDWVKIVTPNTRNLEFGFHDVLLKQGIQHALDTLTKAGSIFNVAGNKPYRFIFNVEGGIRNWPIERYMSKLMGDIISGQNGLALIPHYDHYIGAADRWVSYIKTPAVLASPITASNWHQVNSVETIYQGLVPKTNLNLWKTLGLTQGYVKNPTDTANPYFNIFNSGYETFLFSGLSPLSMRSATMNVYLDNYNVGWEGNSVSTMVYWETFLRRMMFNPMESGFVFSDKPWFAQSFFQSEVKYDSIYTSNPAVTYKGYMYNGGHNNAVVNAELYRLFNWNPIILGCRGLMYDGDTDYPNQVKLVPNDSILNVRIPGYDTVLTDIDFLNHPKIDPDFLDANYNHLSPTMGGLLNTVYQPNTVANTMGTLTNRFYMGKRSVRLEMRKLHEWIRTNESYIMSQRLQAWFGYGYKLWYKQKPGLAQDSIMKKFVNIDNIKTRRIFDCDSNGYNTTPPNFESTFETFCDFTILADTSDLNMNNKFTIGVQNRRTDPLIYFSEESTKKILFLSTAEYDDLCQYGGKNPMDSHSKRYDDTVWQKYKYKSFGTREITIPFNYCDTTKPDEYVLLHVKELKADNAYDSTWSWWRKERYANYIDTVIGQNSSLAVKFLPGEGKLFSCEVLRPNSIQGNLAHSNQSKLIVFPDAQDTTKVRYHTTYHKPDSNRSGVMSVYYRRSFPIGLKSDNKQIIWEPEILLSNGIMLKIRGSFPAPERDTTMFLVPAYYPSLVVRKEESNTKAYIVFQGLVNDDRNHHCENTICTFPYQDPCKDFLNPICEAVLDVGGASLITPPTLVRAIHQIVYGDINNFGAPVINSSKESLYISWADSLCGIGVGNKVPNTIGLTSTNFIKAIDGITTHPSLNIYSLSDKNENDCSLVWEEKSDTYTKSIYYTKLRMDGSNIVNFLPTQISSPQNLEVSNNCLKVSDNHSCELPTVYRLLSYQGSGMAHFVGFEIIAWNSIDEKNINTRTFRHHFDTNNTEPYFWSILYPQRSIKSKALLGGGQISNLTHNFSKPVLSQMNSFNLGGNGLPNPNNHNYLLNFVDNWNISILGSSGNVIYHLNDIFNSINDVSINTSEFSKSIYPVSKGNNVHLAYSPKLNNEYSNVWKNNRIYEDSHSKIISNPIYFYPINECPECIKSQLFIEFEKPNSGGGISKTKFALTGALPTPLPINLPYQFVSDSLGDYLEPIKKDTLFTDWFYIDSSATVEYLIKLNDTNHVTMRLQKLSDSSFVELPAPFLAGSGFAQQVFHLVNGNNDEYRLAMVNNDTLLNYVENVYFEEPFIADTIYSKKGFEVKQNVINLNKNIQTNKLFSINCMPNPANEILNIAVYSNQSAKVESVSIKIYNQQGMLVNEYQSSINSTLSIPVTQMTNGVYMIKASIFTPDGIYNESSKVMILK